MRDSKNKRYQKNRQGEKVGAGFFVFRRHRSSGRIVKSEMPYEHKTLEQAIAEADRLSKAAPGVLFEVFGSMHIVFTMTEQAVDLTSATYVEESEVRP
jgi:hypothetical protein